MCFVELLSPGPGSFRIAFCAASEPGRTFDIDMTSLDTQILTGRQWRPLGQDNPFSFKWNPGVTQALASFDPDVVVLSGYAHPTMILAARWCLRRRVRYAIACETSARSTMTTGWRWLARRGAIGWMVRGMTFGLPVGREAAAYLRHLGPSNVPMHYFPNTPDVTPFANAARTADDPAAVRALRVRYGVASEGPLFIFVGRLIDAKRPTDAVAAFRQLPAGFDARLLIVGDGDQMKTLRTAAADDPRVVFHGWESNGANLARLFAAATALVLPSQHEPWGAVVNEAMAAGQPSSPRTVWERRWN